jgi:hypothetical protein
MRRECREAVKKRKQEANRLSSPIMMPPCRKKGDCNRKSPNQNKSNQTVILAVCLLSMQEALPSQVDASKDVA